jgi:hypothetical protein
MLKPDVTITVQQIEWSRGIKQSNSSLNDFTNTMILNKCNVVAVHAMKHKEKPDV